MFHRKIDVIVLISLASVVCVSCPFNMQYSSVLWCCHISPDKGNGRRTDRKNAKKRLSGGGSAVKVIAEVVRSAYVPDK